MTTKLKIVFPIILIIALILGVAPASYAAAEKQANIKVEPDCKVLFFDNEMELTLPVLNVNDRLLYPFREILEEMGAKVEWDEATSTAKGTVYGRDFARTVEFTIDSETYKSNGYEINMDPGVTAILYNDRTYIPIRYAAECLGYQVLWFDETKTVSIGYFGEGV